MILEKRGDNYNDYGYEHWEALEGLAEFQLSSSFKRGFPAALQYSRYRNCGALSRRGRFGGGRLFLSDNHDLYGDSVGFDGGRVGGDKPTVR